MLLALLPATLAIAILVSVIVVRLFHHPIVAILRRIVSEELSSAWQRVRDICHLRCGGLWRRSRLGA